ncbi:hypothetical protein E1B28_005955 [Marasmius oreades]|uniref:Glutamine amidotransferase domain-containing protein n=1 Tax=Marasmius oreades TaxID=181124 RepID=A0A9P7UVZ0_9AGAR|nr:uncharacterized protein E1B28_005955 [Marasmius oreades]KAG7095176.1 hypothetical protein E1B28_005955 [Marasmius oreades]
MTPRVVRIALFLCDTPIPSVLSTHGDYTRIFQALLHQTRPADSEYLLDPYDVVNKMEYPTDSKLKEYDAIMLTGSAASAYSDVPWITKLVSYIARFGDLSTNPNPQLKLIGVCFGHQIIAMALGGTCERTPGARWEIGPTPIKLTQLGKEVFDVEDDELNIQQMHRDYVPCIPSQFHLLASTDTTMNQGMVRFFDSESPTSHDTTQIQILTVQGHPEFTEPIVTEILKARHAMGVVDDATRDDVTRRKDWRNDGHIVVRTVWRILGE